MFDEPGGRPLADPTRTAQQLSAPVKRKRFYSDVAIADCSGGYNVTLDGKPIRTPGRMVIDIPSRIIAETVCGEWRAQSEFIDLLSMPMTRLANSVVEGVIGREQLVADDIAKYIGNDLIFYRADHPDALVDLQSRHWDPMLRWAAHDLGAHFIMTQGIMPVRQPDSAIAAVRELLPSDAWTIGALHVVTTITGSAILAIAFFAQVIGAEAIWQAAHVDEDWNASQWGTDDEAIMRRAGKRRDFDAAAIVLADRAW